MNELTLWPFDNEKKIPLDLTMIYVNNTKSQFGIGKTLNDKIFSTITRDVYIWEDHYYISFLFYSKYQCKSA